MDSLETWKIDLNALKEGDNSLQFHADNHFFEQTEGSEIRGGDVQIDVKAYRRGRVFELDFHTFGTIVIGCDICLDDMQQEVDGQNRVIAKFGKEESIDDDLIMIDENEGMLDISWLVYEFIALDIPIKHVHTPGKCNPAMIKKLKEHSANRSGDEDEEIAIDPRWSKLKELKINN